MRSEQKIERIIDVFVRDRIGRPIPGATIKFKLNDANAGEIQNAEGRGRIELMKRDVIIEVSAIYKRETQTVKLSTKQDSYTFTFNVDIEPGWGKFMERHLALWVGLVIFAVAIGLAFAFSSPTPLQTRIILGAFSLGGGAIATEISGMISVNLNLGQKLVIGATGALAIFVILYLVLPA
jgi:hypothetical protein